MELIDCAATASNAVPSTKTFSSAANVSVLDEVHKIIIPPIPCSFPWKNHPDCKQLAELSNTWILRNFNNLTTGAERSASLATEHLINSAFHMLATLTFATGIRERMPPILKMMDWIFLLDTILDDPCEVGADPARADNVIDSVLPVFRDTYIHPCLSCSPLVSILVDTAVEWWVEICKDMSPKQKARLSKALCDHVESNRLQVSYRKSRKLPDVDTYFKMRDNTAGWWPFAILIEYSQAFELDDEALSHPLLKALQENVSQHIFLANDITSFKKEYAQGDFFNLVSILYFKKLYSSKSDNNESLAPTLQGAVLDVLQMIKVRDDECVRLMAKINKCEELIKKPYMENYLEGLGLWMSGSIYWHLVSSRFGISATMDIHATMPNMLAHHHVNIETNTKASYVIPCRVGS